MVTTIAGQAQNYGTNDGTGGAARFFQPWAISVDGATNLYVADTYNNTIRKMIQVGTNWVVSTLAGSPGVSGPADGTGTGAHFYYPYGLAADSASNVYVADTYNQTVREITPDGVVRTLAGQPGSYGHTDGTGTAAVLFYPYAIAVDTGGNLFVADGDYTIRKMSLVGTNWMVTTIAGASAVHGSADGAGSAACFTILSASPWTARVMSSWRTLATTPSAKASFRNTPRPIQCLSLPRRGRDNSW